MKTGLKTSLLAVVFVSGPLLGVSLPAGSAAVADRAPGTAFRVDTPAQLMQMKMRAICARADKNLDGYISGFEFVALNQADTVFKATDGNRDGRLSPRECALALGIS